MIDFSKVTELSIPEGKVIQITDKNGVVLWSAIKRYVSLGDSIAAGHFINNAWDTDYGESSQFSCNGRTEPTVIVEGCYTDLIRDDMAKGNKKVSAVSFARSGDKVAQLIAKLSNKTVADELAKANTVTICIGANDVLQDAMKGLEYYISTGDLSAIQSDIDKNMKVLSNDSNSNSYMSLFNKLTDDINPNAQYIFTTVYNPYKWLHLEEGSNGFFGPLLSIIPEMNIDVDKIIEEKFLDGKDLAYPSISWEGITWTSIELDIDLDGYIKGELLDTDAVKMLFNRVNRISDFTEGLVTELNTILKSKVLAKRASYPKFGIAETKALFDTYPDRPTSASVHYNDLVHVAFTRGYNTALMDWGALWRDYGSGTMEEKAVQYWTDLAWKYLIINEDFIKQKVAGILKGEGISWNPWDYVSFNMEGFAKDLVDQIINKVIVPNVDPHPTKQGHEVLKQAFDSAMK